MVSPFRIDDARPEDAEAILVVHRAAVRQTAATAYDVSVIEEWAPLPITRMQIDELSARIANGAEIAVVARIGTGIVGFGAIVVGGNELRAVYVAPDVARTGVGRAILDRLVMIASELKLTHLTMDASLNAEAFYLHHGFVTEGRGTHILASGKTMACVRMRMTLKD